MFIPAAYRQHTTIPLGAEPCALAPCTSLPVRVSFGTMGQRRHHYERAFEDYLRSRDIPYVSVNEARKAILPPPAEPATLKSFDFVVYNQSGVNLLVDVKGRRVAARSRNARTASSRSSHPSLDFGSTAQQQQQQQTTLLDVAPAVGRLESWVTEDDIRSLHHWAQLFGPDFSPVFVFAFWCDDQPPDALFCEMFECKGRWYALRTVSLHDYTKHMKPRSPKWRTVHLPTKAFDQIASPFPPTPYPLQSRIRKPQPKPNPISPSITTGYQNNPGSLHS